MVDENLSYTETICLNILDDLFEDVTLDLDPVTLHVPSLGSQVQGLLPLPLLDPLLNGERECGSESFLFLNLNKHCT